MGGAAVRLLIAFILLVSGALLAAVGLSRALLQFGAMYQKVSERPLDEPDLTPEDRAEKMLWSAGLGAAGVPMILVGTIMLKTKRRRKRR